MPSFLTFACHYQVHRHLQATSKAFNHARTPDSEGSFRLYFPHIGASQIQLDPGWERIERFLRLSNSLDCPSPFDTCNLPPRWLRYLGGSQASTKALPRAQHSHWLADHGFRTSVYFYSISKVRAFMAARHFAISILTHRSSLLYTVHCCTGQARRLLGSCRDQGARRHRLNTCHYRGGSQAQSMIRQVSMQRNTECHYSIFIRGPEILLLRCLSPAARFPGII